MATCATSTMSEPSRSGPQFTAAGASHSRSNLPRASTVTSTVLSTSWAVPVALAMSASTDDSASRLVRACSISSLVLPPPTGTCSITVAPHRLPNTDEPISSSSSSGNGSYPSEANVASPSGPSTGDNARYIRSPARRVAVCANVRICWASASVPSTGVPHASTGPP